MAFDKIPEIEMTPTQVAMLAIMARRKTETSVQHIWDTLCAMGWNVETPHALYTALASLQLKGLVQSQQYAGGNKKKFTLSQQGFELLKTYTDFFVTMSRECKTAFRVLSRKRLPNGRPKMKSVPIQQRLPNAGESKRILKNARESFRLIYGFSILTSAPIIDLIDLRIRSVDLRKGKVSLPKKSSIGRTLRAQVLKLDRQAKSVLKEAIGTRKVGLVFRTHLEQGWTSSGIGTTFRRLRNKLNISRNVVLTGHGGILGRELRENAKK